MELYSLEFCSLTASNAEFSVGELFVSALVADTPEVEVVATKPDLVAECGLVHCRKRLQYVLVVVL